MKRSVFSFTVMALLAGSAFAAALGTSANAVIPQDVQQVISVDYRRMIDSPTAMALKARVLPDNLKQFETALKGVGIDPNKDVDQLTFASFRTPTQGVRIIGIASGQFARPKILKKMQVQKIKPTKYHTSFLYPMNGGMEMTFLDDTTMLFGEDTAIKFALGTRDGENASMMSNGRISEMVQDVNGGAVWSVLDQQGTQNMMRSTLGDAAKLTDYETVKKRLLGSYYTMDFSSGVKLDLNVLTSDAMTATTLSSLLRAGIMFKKMNATPIEKTAMDSTTVESDNDKLKVHFMSDDEKFQSLLHSELFTAVSR